MLTSLHCVVVGEFIGKILISSRVMADELTNSRAVLQRQHRDAQGALQDLLSEREQLRQGMKATHRYGPLPPTLLSSCSSQHTAVLQCCCVYSLLSIYLSSISNRRPGEGR